MRNTGAQDPDDWIMSEQELKDIIRQEEIWLEAEIEEQNRKRKEKRGLERKNRRAAMEVPIEPFPEREKSKYEKIRENNIKEREKAMVEAGFFEDLYYKKKIDFV